MSGSSVHGCKECMCQYPASLALRIAIILQLLASLIYMYASTYILKYKFWKTYVVNVLVFFYFFERGGRASFWHTTQGITYQGSVTVIMVILYLIME